MQGRGQAAGITVVAAQAGVPQLGGSSLKAALDADWDDPAARDAALARVLGFFDQVEAFAARQGGGLAAAGAVAVARQVRDQGRLACPPRCRRCAPGWPKTGGSASRTPR